MPWRTQNSKRNFPTSATNKWSQLSNSQIYFPRWQIIWSNEQTLHISNQWEPAIVPQKVRPNIIKPLPSVHPNIIEDDDGKCYKIFQHKVHMSSSGPHIILPEFLVRPQMVQTAQPPRVDTEEPSFNLLSRGKKNPIIHFALTSQFQKFHEANTVTHEIYGVAQEYRHLVKGPDRKFWERSFTNELWQLAQGIRMVKGKNTVIFIPKT